MIPIVPRRTPEEEKKHKRKQNIVAAAIIIVGAVASFLIFGPKKPAGPAPEEAPAAALVKTIKLTSDGARVAKLEKTATWGAGDESAEALSEYSGRVTKVSFEVGDSVKMGQVLAVFDQSGLKNAPRVTLDSAQRNYDVAQENFSDTEDLMKKNIDLAERAVKIAKLQEDETDKSDLSTSEQKDIADQNVKIAKDQEEQAKRSAEVQINGARLQLEQARASLKQARIEYEKTIIKAPISGKIVSKNLNEQDFLNPGDTVASIVGDGQLSAIIYLNGNEAERIKSGDAAEVRVNEKKYPGRIASFSKIANDANERFEVKILTDENLTKNANRTGSVILNVYLNAEEGFFVPLDAVNIGQSKKEVYVVEEGKAVAKNVELGKIIGTQIEVLGGLESGAEIIVENSRNLTSGQLVRVSI